MSERQEAPATRAAAGTDPVRSDVVAVHAPSREDPFVRGGSPGLGGPLGRHAWLGRSWWTPIRVLILLTMLSSLLMYAEKAPCRNQPWNSGFQYSHACYNDVFPLYFGEGLDSGKVPYFDAHGQNHDQNVEYPVLIGAAMQAGAAVAHLAPKSVQAQRFLDATWVMMMIAAVVAVVATALTHRRRPWDAALLACAPGLILAGLINWDLLAVALTALAMLAWARRKPFGAGLLFGLAIATKFYPIVLFAPLFMLCLRARQLRAFWLALGGAALSWAVVDVPVWILRPTGFATFYTFSKTRPPDWGSIWYAFQESFHHTFAITHVNFYEGALFAMSLLGIAALTFGASRRPRLPQVFFLTLAMFLVVNKVYSPQYVLWLLPLFALARPRWRAFLVWQAAEVVYFLGIWLYLLNYTRPGKGLELVPYLISLGIRDVAVLVMCGLVVFDVLAPQHDVVRADGSDDPDDGVLDGVADSYVEREPELVDA